MGPFLQHLIEAQRRRPTVYAEPFAGGGGAAFHLLTEGAVSRIALNDLNPGIASFWGAVFNDTERLARKIMDVPVSIDMWHQQRQTYLKGADDPFDHGFATFFLNRTNRSGILRANPIGGLDQTGTWKLDARFNRTNLAERVRHLGTYRHQVAISQEDGRVFLRSLDSERQQTLFYVDPPYIRQGEDLYLSNMTYLDHVDLARTLQRLDSPWVLTYDRDERIPEDLYAGLPCATFTISHTAAKQHIGSEYLVVPRNVAVSSLDGFGPRPGQWLPGRAPSDVARHMSPV